MSKEIQVSKTNEIASFSAETLISQAISKGVSVGTMERLLAMRRELKAEQAKEAYDTAMAAFQSECPVIKKTKVVKNKDGTVRYQYAPIEAIVIQIKDLIQKHGFSYTVDTLVEEGWVTAICKVTHALGHSETSRFKIPVDKDSYMNAPQRFASALTFGKRYAFCNAFGILTGDEDDDSVSVGGEPQENAPQRHVEARSIGSVQVKQENVGKPASPSQIQAIYKILCKKAGADLASMDKLEMDNKIKDVYKVDMMKITMGEASQLIQDLQGE